MIRYSLAALMALVASPGLAADTLTVFDWAGYEDPGFHADYIAKHGGVPQFAFFGDEEEAFQKLRSGFRADLSHPCSQSVVKWHAAGLLEPIDPTRIAAWETLNRNFRDLEGFSFDGKPYVVPMEWGNTLMTYRTDVVTGEDAKTLQSFADPKFAGRVSIGDNVDDAYALASLAIGVRDWTKMTDAQFEEASAFLRKVHENVRIYWSDPAELTAAMASGEIGLAWAWNDAGVKLKAEGHPVVATRDTTEGASSWVCGYVLLKGGEGSKDLAYDFLNSWLSTSTADFLVNAWGYGSSNDAAMAALDPGQVATAGYDNTDKFRDRTLFQAPTPPALRERMIAEFEKIKAGF